MWSCFPCVVKSGSFVGALMLAWGWFSFLLILVIYYEYVKHEHGSNSPNCIKGYIERSVRPTPPWLPCSCFPVFSSHSHHPLWVTNISVFFFFFLYFLFHSWAGTCMFSYIHFSLISCELYFSSLNISWKSLYICSQESSSFFLKMYHVSWCRWTTVDSSILCVGI